VSCTQCCPCSFLLFVLCLSSFCVMYLMLSVLWTRTTLGTWHRMKTNKAKKVRMNTDNIRYMTQNEDKQSKKSKNEQSCTQCCPCSFLLFLLSLSSFCVVYLMLSVFILTFFALFVFILCHVPNVVRLGTWHRMKTNKANKIRMNTGDIRYMTQNEDKQSKKNKNEHLCLHSVLCT
jgi:Mg2+/Co2+ transporter CorB